MGSRIQGLGYKVKGSGSGIPYSLTASDGALFLESFAVSSGWE